MELKVYGRNVKVTERLEGYVAGKAEKFEQLGDHVSDIEIKFTKDGHTGPNTIRVEITVVGRGPVLRAESVGSDKYAVFDDTYGKLLERLRRARDRRKVQRHGGRSPISVSEATGALPVVTDQTAVTEVHDIDVPVEEAAFDNEFALTDEVQSPIEIRRKSFPAEKLSPEEAVDRMELVGHDFYLFVDAETDTPSAVYRRKGWTYGVISLTNEA